MPPRRASMLFVVPAVGICMTIFANAATAAPLLAHQALYELSLKNARGSSSLEAARGQILNEFSGDACDGYTTTFRQISDLDSGSGKLQRISMSMKSWEDGKGKSYRFKVETRTNDGRPSVVEGVAERSPDKLSVRLKKPFAKTVVLNGSIVFPTEQIQRIIEAAQAGQTLLPLQVYDGSDTGEKVYTTLAVIGQPRPVDRVAGAPDPATGQESMKALKRWPVTVSYFERDAKKTDGTETPAYTTSFELYENGIQRALLLDYNDFVIAGDMKVFDVKPSKACK